MREGDLHIRILFCESPENGRYWDDEPTDQDTYGDWYLCALVQMVGWRTCTVSLPADTKWYQLKTAKGREEKLEKWSRLILSFIRCQQSDALTRNVRPCVLYAA